MLARWDLMRVVDEQIEMLKDVSGEDPANVAVRQLCLSKVLNDRQHVFDDVGTGINGVELSKGSAGVGADPGDPGGPLCLEVEFGGQGRIDCCDLGAGTHQKIVRTGVVDGFVFKFADVEVRENGSSF